MMEKVELSTPANTMMPVGPYSHIAKVGQFITIGGTAGVDPATGDLAGSDVASQTKQILDAFEIMLQSVGSDLDPIPKLQIYTPMNLCISISYSFYKEILCECGKSHIDRNLAVLALGPNSFLPMG